MKNGLGTIILFNYCNIEFTEVVQNFPVYIYQHAAVYDCMCKTYVKINGTDTRITQPVCINFWEDTKKKLETASG